MPAIVACEKCGKVCSSTGHLSDHRRIHVKKHACENPQCRQKSPPARFATKKDLNRHQRTVHDRSDNRRLCIYCQVELVWRADNFKRHLDTHHNGGITVAVSKGDETTVVWYLANYPGCANGRGSNGTPLFLAARWGHEKIALLLLDNGADIEEACHTTRSFPGEPHMVTPLREAIVRKHYGVAQLLIRRGADVKIAFRIGSYGYLLTYVVDTWSYQRDLDLVRQLFDHDADTYRKLSFAGGALEDVAGLSPFTQECLEMVKVLLEGGASRWSGYLGNHTAFHILRSRHSEGEVSSNPILAEAMELLRPKDDIR